MCCLVYKYIPQGAWDMLTNSLSFRAAIPNLFGTRDRFHGRQFFHGEQDKRGWPQGDSSAWRLLCTIPIIGEGNGTHSSTLAWKIPWTEEPGGLQSMGSLRVGRNWATSLSLSTFMHWRRKWQPTPVFLPGESQGRGSLVGCHLWGRTESDTTDTT